MEEVQIAEKSCKNCRFFVQYYFKCHMRFDTIDCGHCRAYQGFHKKAIVCARWEEKENALKETKTSVESYMEKIGKRLREITAFLTDKENDEV